MIGRTISSIQVAGMSVLLAMLWPSQGDATVYAVGSGGGCTHASVQEAINAAVSDTAPGPHLIRLTTGTISVPNGLLLHNAVADMTIEGGYSGCAGSLGSNTRTVLDASGGADGTVLDIRYFGASVLSRSIHLSRLDITGGTGETGIFSSSEGAGLELRGNLKVVLEQTHVRDNRAYRAAGILMQGGPGIVTLFVSNQSSVSGNVADTDGGGVWCYNLGLIFLEDGSIDFNQAGRDGGGLWLGTQCALVAGNSFLSPGTITLLDNNSAGTIYGGRGGAVFYQSSQPRLSPYDMQFDGSPTNPILLINNSAACNTSPCASGAGEGGAIYAEGLAAESIPISVKDTTFINNTAGFAGSAISVQRGIHLALTGSAARCNGLFGYGLCSAIVGGDTTAINIFDNASTNPAVAPNIDIRRTRFTGNAGRNVINAFVWYNNAALLAVVDSIFDNNTVGAVIDSDLSYDLRYTTVIANTLSAGTTPGVFGWYPKSATDTGLITMDGSIIWQPGATVMYSPADASRYHAFHFGCLLANNLAGIVNSAPVRTGNPQLDANFVPGPTSPALDVCNGGLDTEFDAYGTPRPIDQPGVANLLGAYDLGAVERPLSDRIFANGFQ